MVSHYCLGMEGLNRETARPILVSSKVSKLNNLLISRGRLLTQYLKFNSFSYIFSESLSIILVTKFLSIKAERFAGILNVLFEAFLLVS